MASITIDLSGAAGLVPQSHGDVNQNVAGTNLRYLGADGQMASGYYNPIKKYGYLSPAVGTAKELTGTISGPINAIHFEPEGGDLYITQGDNEILTLSSLSDTSLSVYKTLTSAYTVIDSELYELNGNKALFYLINSGTDIADGGNGYVVGFSFLDTADNATAIDSGVNLLTSDVALSVDLVRSASEGIVSQDGRKLAQQFYSDDLEGLQLSGVDLMLSLEGGTGAGITIKVSIQTEADSATSPYTSRGAWSNAVTDYVVNDTVTNGGNTWACIQAHNASSTANDEPGVGSDWELYWVLFGSPSGTELTSATFLLSSISNYASSDSTRKSLIFSSPITLTAATKYWIVIEESGSNMGASDKMSWKHTTNGNGTYARLGRINYSTGGYWFDINLNGDTLSANHDNFDFRLNVNSSETWSKDIAYGKFNQERIPSGSIYDQRTFLHISDNALMYWVVGNKMHTIDGSITGGEYGKISESVIQFPAYLNIVDIAETRSRMYVGVQTSTPITGSTSEFYEAQVCGVFVWDRKSQVQGQAELYQCPGAMSIAQLYTSSNGSVYAITINATGEGEIRTANGNQFEVIRKIGQKAWPSTRRSVVNTGGLSVWLGVDSNIYGFGSPFPGEKEGFFTLGSLFAYTASDLLNCTVAFAGNTDNTSPNTAVLFGTQPFSTSTYDIFKWIPNGEGTLDSVAQTAMQGDIYTKVNYLPSLSTIRDLTIYCAPTSTSAGTTIATINLYKNQSTTAFSTKTITDSMCNKGYVHFNLNEHNCNAIQMEIEYATTSISTTSIFHPSVAILSYEPTTTRSPDIG